MLAPDVNVLVYAHREELAEHEACRRWLEETLAADAAFGIFDAVLSGFVRVVTHPRVFNTPSPLEIALAFERLCLESGAKGNIVADAYHAALAIEAGCEWVTTDRDYSRFTALRWQSPIN